jgi:hypothetical protein
MSAIVLGALGQQDLAVSPDVPGNGVRPSQHKGAQVA